MKTYYQIAIWTLLIVALGGCATPTDPRDLSQYKGEYWEATVYDVSKTPRVPLSDAWVEIEYWDNPERPWYVYSESKGFCAILYSVKADANGKVRFPANPKLQIRLGAYKQGYGYPKPGSGWPIATAKQPFAIYLFPVVRNRAEDFRFLTGATGSSCWQPENQLRELAQAKEFFQLAKNIIDSNNREEIDMLSRLSERIDTTEKSIGATENLK